MKITYLLLLLTALQIFTIKDGDTFKVYATKHYDNYNFYYASDSKDTVVFIAQSRLLKTCRSSAKFISKDNLSTISEFETKSGHINFTYSVPTISCGVKTVQVGNEPPGRKDTEYIYTYSSYPYLIKNCSSFKQ